MPALKIFTNVKHTPAEGRALAKALSAQVAKAADKPEIKMGVSVHYHPCMVFAGTEGPCALGTWEAIGHVDIRYNTAVSSTIAALLKKHLGVPVNRYHISVRDLKKSEMMNSGATVENPPASKL